MEEKDEDKCNNYELYISFDISKVSMPITENGVFSLSNIDGIPESLKGQIKSAEAGTKLDDIGRMLLTVCDYKRLNKAIPRFDVSMELSGNRCCP